MKKPRTALQLQEALDSEFAWRQLEIHALRQVSRMSRGANQRSVLRAAVPILYAHWEGFVKEGTCLYVRYLSGLGLGFNHLKRCFRGLAALNHVRTMGEVRRRIFVSSELLEKLYGIEIEHFHASLDGHLTRVGNLNYDLFEQILSFVGIDSSRYTTRKPLIDERLLFARNKIAHGEYLDLDQSGLEDLSHEVMTLLRWVKTDIENSVTLKTYLIT
jgi:MAE_28990/MAE_18760-like HEPN